MAPITVEELRQLAVAEVARREWELQALEEGWREEEEEGEGGGRGGEAVEEEDEEEEDEGEDEFGKEVRQPAWCLIVQ